MDWGNRSDGRGETQTCGQEGGAQGAEEGDDDDDGGGDDDDGWWSWWQLILLRCGRSTRRWLGASRSKTNPWNLFSAEENWGVSSMRSIQKSDSDQRSRSNCCLFFMVLYLTNCLGFLSLNQWLYYCKLEVQIRTILQYNFVMWMISYICTHFYEIRIVNQSFCIKSFSWNGKWSGGNLCLWKKGSITNHILVNLCDCPMFWHLQRLLSLLSNPCVQNGFIFQLVY